jgi:hypothetical protein
VTPRFYFSLGQYVTQWHLGSNTTPQSPSLEQPNEKKLNTKNMNGKRRKTNKHKYEHQTLKN